MLGDAWEYGGVDAGAVKYDGANRFGKACPAGRADRAGAISGGVKRANGEPQVKSVARGGRVFECDFAAVSFVSAVLPAAPGRVWDLVGSRWYDLS